MTISTLYSIGDTMILNGKEYTVVSVHLYESAEKHTERYYLGNGKWIALENEFTIR